jgi:alkylhydroperoxidase/carboxymuconolactone decarboxylase family protein YurZ
MNWIIQVWAREPVVITAVVDAVIALAVALGLPVSDQVKVAIDGLIVALGVLIARSQVSSPATVAALIAGKPKTT